MNRSTGQERLTCRRAGAGPALVFVHGYLGGSAQWQGQIDRYARFFDVIAPDLPGFGDAAHLTSPDRIEGHACRLIALLDELGVDRFRLVGHSMGGMIVQEMARMAAPRIERLVLYGTGPLGVMPDRFEPIAISRKRVSADGVPATARRISATWFLDGEKAPGHAAAAALGEPVSLQAAIAGLDAMEAWDGRDGLSGIAIPTLILWGDRDRSYGWSQPEALWRGIANSRLAVVPGCAHMVHVEKPEIFDAILSDFLLETNSACDG